ncbi:MAG: hypothetical protein JXR76_15785 [Deltaproteobacteria bacterium]|nr:hypothetical protein [Deltaproteobacteria bacterium]
MKDGIVQSVAYFSDKSDPNRDLAFVMNEYSEGQEWNALTSGSLYQREDRARRLWCSAMTAIGVGLCAFLDSEKRDEGEDQAVFQCAQIIVPAPIESLICGCYPNMVAQAIECFANYCYNA